MKILIVEDEPPIAIDIKEMCCEILNSRIEKIDIVHTLDDAKDFLEKKSVDLCLLDLNLKGENGYDILKQTMTYSFHTIIISAYTDQAIDAFNYGVLDFVPKPVNKNRLQAALDKYLGSVENIDNSVKFLIVRKRNSNHLISVDEIKYFEAQRYVVIMRLKEGKTEIIEKPLNRLMQILPKNFIRTHRSFIVDINEILSYRHAGGGVYELQLKDGTTLPLSPSTYHLLHEKADKK